jgi:hypothetical protein
MDGDGVTGALAQVVADGGLDRESVCAVTEGQQMRTLIAAEAHRFPGVASDYMRRRRR